MKSFKQALLEGEFIAKVQEATKGEPLNSANSLLKVLSPMISYHRNVEKFYVIYLDVKNNTLLIDPTFSGSLNSCAIYPREIIKKAIELGAASLILAHNHPSGDLMPSKEDKSITKYIIIACDVHGIKVHDHVIVSETDYFSFNQNGIIAKLEKNWNHFKFQEDICYE